MGFHIRLGSIPSSNGSKKQSEAKRSESETKSEESRSEAADKGHEFRLSGPRVPGPRGVAGGQGIPDHPHCGGWKGHPTTLGTFKINIFHCPHRTPADPRDSLGYPPRTPKEPQGPPLRISATVDTTKGHHGNPPGPLQAPQLSGQSVPGQLVDDMAGFGTP